VTAVIEQFGVVGVFLLMVPESACVPVPSEVTLLFSGFAVSSGWMSFPLAVVAATAGNVVGSLIAYALGATGWAERVPGVASLLRRWSVLLDRHGTRAVFVARLLPLARTFVSLPAGARGVPLAPFVALTTAGCALWAAAFILAGALAGAAWQQLSAVIAWPLLVAGVAALLLLSWRGRRARRAPPA
jgi:membrane protein DedA with SNARE-associated domain